MQAMNQNQAALSLLDRVRESLPSEELRRVFGDLVDTVRESFRLEEACEGCEGVLMAAENEMRQAARSQPGKAGAHRKEVDRQRA